MGERLWVCDCGCATVGVRLWVCDCGCEPVSLWVCVCLCVCTRMWKGVGRVGLWVVTDTGTQVGWDLVLMCQAGLWGMRVGRRGLKGV